MKCTVVECQHPNTYLRLHPENEAESLLIARLALNAKPQDVTVKAYLSGTATSGEIHFRTYKDHHSSISNRGRSKR